jgi:starch synthase
VVADGVDGFVVPPESAPLADRIATLLADPGRAREMGREGRRKVDERYGWATLARLTEDVYRAVKGA